MDKPPEITALPWTYMQSTQGGGLPDIRSVLEFGATEHKPAFLRLGISHVSVDPSGANDSLPYDYESPLDMGKFDMVTNFGASAHAADQEIMWQNIVDATHQVMVSFTPLEGRRNITGVWYLSEEFYESLAALNKFEIRLMEQRSWEKFGRTMCVRMRRRGYGPFVMPTVGMTRR